MASSPARTRQLRARQPTNTEADKARRIALARAIQEGVSKDDAEEYAQQKMLDVLQAGWRGDAQFSTVVRAAVEKGIAQLLQQARTRVSLEEDPAAEGIPDEGVPDVETLSLRRLPSDEGEAPLEKQIADAAQAINTNKETKPPRAAPGALSKLGAVLRSWVASEAGQVEALISADHYPDCTSGASCCCGPRQMVEWLRDSLDALAAELAAEGIPYALRLPLDSEFDRALLRFIVSALDTGSGGWVESDEARCKRRRGRKRGLPYESPDYWQAERIATSEAIARKALSLAGVSGALMAKVCTSFRVQRARLLDEQIRKVVPLQNRRASKRHDRKKTCLHV